MIRLANVHDAAQARFNRLIAQCVGADLETFIDEMPGLCEMRFPPAVFLQHPDKCTRVLKELLLFAEDELPHELDALHSYALLLSLEDALQWERDSLKNATDTNEARAIERRVRALDRLCEDAFTDHDFMEADTIAQDVLNGGPMCAHLGIDAGAFVELMADDIRARVEQHLKAAEEDREQGTVSPAETPPP
jgi:hypothetical protein